MSDDDEPQFSDRKRTDKINPIVIAPLRIEVDLEDAISVAEFLEAVASSIRLKKRIILMIE